MFREGGAAILLALQVADGSGRGQFADTIYRGGDVVTIDDKNPTAEAVAIQGG